MWAHHGYWCFPFLLFILILAFFIFRSFAFRGRCRYGSWHHDDAELILRKRLAGGEIDESEYEKLMAVLKR